ncbi:MAG: PBSX family phage terminase large subunit [Candidatus Heimdallarchaeaceae archaeon]
MEKVIKITPSKIYKPLFTKKPRYFLCMGGRASGRSYSASQFSLMHLIADKYFRCAIMRFVLGDIRNSIYQEIRDRIEEQELDEVVNIRQDALCFEFGDNKISGIGFRKSSSDQKSKLKSLASYNVIIIEEADEVAEEDFMQLDDSIRTTKSDITIILLLNPPHKTHWIVNRWFNLEKSGIEGFYKAKLKSTAKDSIYIHGTYKDNIKNLNQKTIDNYERYKTTNPEHYYNMIRGLVSEGARGRVFKDWKIISDKEYEELPYEVDYGLDFGFSNDEAALIEIKEHNDKVWCRELLYETGLTNTGDKGNDLDGRFETLGLKKESATIYADSAEPKSIEELNQSGWNVIGAPKGADSVRAGLNLLQGKEIHFTESSNNIASETQNFKWALDRDKKPTNKAIDKFNHAISAIRYNQFAKMKKEFIGFI